MKKFFLLSLLSLCLVSCNTTPTEKHLTDAGVSRELATFRKAHYADVCYELSFVIPEKRSEAVSGTALLRFQTADKQPLIVDFRAEASQVHGVKLNGKSVPYKVEKEHILLPEQLSSVGENELSISFTSADQSLNRREEFLYTLLVPDRARTVFPCFDQPNLKARYTLTLDVPQTWQAVSNGKVASEEMLPKSKRIAFHQTEPLSTYLFSFVAGKLKNEHYNRGERSLTIYHRETDKKKIAQCPDIANEVFDALEWMEDYTDVPYPFAKYDVIILPGFQYGGMEHTGATLYTDGRMFLNPHPTLDERLSRSSLIAHETAHMWFGDYVTMEWFSGVWIKEVFANYFASQIVEPRFPEIDHELNFMLDYFPTAYQEDRTEGSNAIQQPLDNLRNAGLVYGSIIYDKSPIMMAKLIERIGTNAYQQGLRQYLQTHAYGNASWEDLMAIFDTLTEEKIAEWSQVWVHERGMPTIATERVGDSLVFKQADPFGRGIAWQQSFGVLVGEERHTVEMNKGAVAIHAPEGKPIVVNVDGKGYGFFALTRDMSAAAFQHLRRSDEAVERGAMQILLYENLQHGTIDASAFCREMLSYLAEEKNPLLYASALGYVRSVMQQSEITDFAELEKALWQFVEKGSDVQRSLQAFRTYSAAAKTHAAIDRLYRIWQTEKPPKLCPLSETDYTSLSYKLAIFLPERADDIVETQAARLTNPDRLQAFRFIAPSVSPKKAVRDSVFRSLLLAENRRIEPWASAALRNLNHSQRQEEALSYVRPSLDVLAEVQRTGDIFFPSAWLSALLSGHHRVEAWQAVEAFLADSPDYSPMLLSKIKQQAHHLAPKDATLSSEGDVCFLPD